ncbi:helix-turn-helix domain-containing protein [Terrimonas ferruginea]|uniref:helix-turn-helix domain-containing protein n=1 Tax=Terrimonas ferruginea TaxID=249 RepID=UPI0004251944|nr:AraC family transcriptional regulator [Terrimonas ferruginea]
MQSLFETYLPASPILRQYIAYFYVDVQEDKKFYRKFSFFPHINTTLSFYKHASLKTGEVSQVESAAGKPLLKLLTRQHRVTTVVQTGPVYKIGIVFLPLGLNHFIRQTYGDLAPEEVQEFNPANAKEWTDQINSSFACRDPREGIQQLEVFLLSVYQRREYGVLEKILRDLNDPHNANTIREVAESHYINHRKLNRDFKKELGITPEYYKMIARFRHAVDLRIMHDKQGPLTTIAYESGYLDQSYMIRSFKKLTGLSPSAFFREGKHLGIGDTFWKFHNTKNVV